MIRRFSEFLLGVLLVALFSQPVAAATETLHFSSHGEFAAADFSSTDDTGCFETDVALAVVDQLVKEDGSPRTLEARALIALVRHDVCTGTVLINAFGFADLGPDQFEMDKLDSAVFNASIPVTDEVSGAAFTLEATLTWQATGILVRDKERLLFRTPDRTVVTRIDCTGSGCLGRGASTAGVVTDGTTNFTPNAGVGVIGQAKIGQVFIERS
jgi:hypothetical protein